ncbi:hypothetical protein MRX96_027761 [Rhipicephalus microplus]
MIDMKALKRKRFTMEELDDVNLGNTFSVEMNQPDEDADMMKYIEEELAQRRGGIQESELSLQNTMDEEDVLFHVPEHLRKSTSKKSEEMLFNQMLFRIPEVDLGIEERIRNIEANEDAKLKIIRDRSRRTSPERSVVRSQFLSSSTWFTVSVRRLGADGSGARACRWQCGGIDERKTAVGVPCGVLGGTRARTASSGFTREEACGAESVKRRAAPDGSRHAGLWGEVERRRMMIEGRVPRASPFLSPLFSPFSPVSFRDAREERRYQPLRADWFAGEAAFSEFPLSTARFGGNEAVALEGACQKEAQIRLYAATGAFLLLDI